MLKNGWFCGNYWQLLSNFEENSAKIWLLVPGITTLDSGIESRRKEAGIPGLTDLIWIHQFPFPVFFPLNIHSSIYHFTFMCSPCRVLGMKRHYILSVVRVTRLRSSGSPLLRVKIKKCLAISHTLAQCDFCDFCDP
jgi:hypothetical protein